VSVRSGLLGSFLLDAGAETWIERTDHLSPVDTSKRLLFALTGGVPPVDVRLEGGITTSALAIGIDSTYLGEPLTGSSDTGTPVDVAAQVDMSAVEHQLAQLIATVKVLNGQ